MPATTEKVDLRHEVFCRPPLARGDGPESAPRQEQYLAYADQGSESVPVFTVHRCLECGAAEYHPI